MAYRYFVGVDPGEKGGIAILTSDGRIINKFVMPMRDDKHINTVLVKDGIPMFTILTPGETLVVVEKVWAMPKQGVCSMFSFGRSTGKILGILETFFDTVAKEVAPQSWQRALWGSSDNPKLSAVNYTASNYPTESFLATRRSRIPHQGLVDAVCIANYARKNVQLISGN